MGAIQEPTPDMGPYIVEARRWSFYLHRTGTPGDGVHWNGVRPGGQLCLPVTDLPRILASLAQAESFVTQQPEQADPGDTSLIMRAWRVEPDGDDLCICGPWWVSVEDYEDTSTAHAEIPYVALVELRALLETEARRRP